MIGKIRALNQYDIFIGTDTIIQLPGLVNLNKYSNIFTIIDPAVEKHLTNRIERSLNRKINKIEVAAGEKNKNIETVQKIWKALKEFGCDRKSLVINIGGGVVGDMGGFAASTFMRGVDFLQIPTTLLAQVDASVGGKVGINFSGIKNLIGTFQQPVAVIIDVNALSTLPPREFISGFAEIIKHGLIADKRYFQLVTGKKPLEFSTEELVKIIERSCKIKANIISADEKEGGPRKKLNFGHTIGHAVESLSQETTHPLLHGEAIGIGMIAEGRISKDIGLLSSKDYQIMEQSLINAGLPVSCNLPVDRILEKIISDKKTEKGETKWTLLKGIGQAVYDQQVDLSIIRKVT